MDEFRPGYTEKYYFEEREKGKVMAVFGILGLSGFLLQGTKSLNFQADSSPLERKFPLNPKSES